MVESTRITESQRVDGGLIVRKQTMIVKNKNKIDTVYKADKKVSLTIFECNMALSFSLFNFVNGI